MAALEGPRAEAELLESLEAAAQRQELCQCQAPDLEPVPEVNWADWKPGSAFSQQGHRLNVFILVDILVGHCQQLSHLSFSSFLLAIVPRVQPMLG